jgi:hypothetical protein
MKNIKTENIWRFQSENKLSSKDMRLLLEAFRRKHFLHTTNGWLGLGTLSTYKSEYFRTHDGDKTPRINHWFVLTEKGKEMMDKMEKRFLVPKNPKKAQEINSFLFNY